MSTQPSEPKQEKVVDFTQWGIQQDDELVEYYACAIWHSPSYRPGWMYISSNFICFSSLVYENKISVRFRDVIAIKKNTSWLNEAIEIVETTSGGQSETYLFSAFVNRDIAFKTLESLWKVMMSQVLKVTEVENWAGTPDRTSTFSKDKGTHSRERLSKYVSNNHVNQSMPKNLLHEFMKENHKSRYISQTPRPRVESADIPQKLVDIPKRRSSFEFIMEEAKKDSKVVTSSTKYIIEKQNRNELIYGKFRIPSDEPVIKDWNVEYWHHNTYLEGWLFLTPHFFLFGCPTIKFIVPLSHIFEITKENTYQVIANGIRIIIHRRTSLNDKVLTQSFFFKTQTEDRNIIFKIISEAFAHYEREPAPMSYPLKKSPESMNLGVAIFSQRRQYGPDYIKTQTNLLPIWDSYMNQYAIGDVGLVQSADFYKLVQGGIPDCYRGHVWKICSGAINKRLCEKKSYKDYHEENKGKKSPSTKQIEIDLRRSLSEHPYFHTESGLSSLRNILVAYSWRNPVLGYCQAMNFIAAGLLLYLDEEDAFWVMSSICEDIVPSNYRPQMMGSQLEQKTFEFLLDYYIPSIASHCRKKEVPIAIISGQWFLSLSLGHAPLEVSFRVLDCWLCINKDSLYRVALALIWMHKEYLLKCSVEQIQHVFRRCDYEASELFEIAWSKFEKLPTDKLNDIRNEHQLTLIKDLRTEAKSRLTQSLESDSRLSKEEIDVLYDKFHESLPITSDHLMTFDVFEKYIFTHLTPYWKDLPVPYLTLKLFESLDADGDELLNVAEFLLGVGALYKMSIEELWSTCYKIATGGKITQESPEDPAENSPIQSQSRENPRDKITPSQSLENITENTTPSQSLENSIEKTTPSQSLESLENSIEKNTPSLENSTEITTPSQSLENSIEKSTPSPSQSLENITEKTTPSQSLENYTENTTHSLPLENSTENIIPSQLLENSAEKTTPSLSLENSTENIIPSQLGDVSPENPCEKITQGETTENPGEKTTQEELLENKITEEEMQHTLLLFTRMFDTNPSETSITPTPENIGIFLRERAPTLQPFSSVPSLMLEDILEHFGLSNTQKGLPDKMLVLYFSLQRHH